MKSKINKMIPWAKPELFGNEKGFILDALHSTWISDGEYVDRFEADFARLIGTKYAVTTSSGTAALHLALLAAEIGPGDEVIIPDFTFVAPANMVLQIGAKPVYVDINPNTWCIDINEVEKNITDRTKAIIPVHVYGNICDMEALVRTAEDNGIYLIEDVAEAAFSRYRGKSAGSFGALGCFSFQATKAITTGEGGAVVTNDEELSKQVRILRNHGMRAGKRYWHDVVGYNYRLTNIQAAFGCAQLEKIDKMIDEKNRIYRRYLKNLSDLPGIEFQHIPEEVEPVIWAAAIKMSPEYFKGGKDYVMAELLKRNVETRPGFYPFHTMPLYDAPLLPVAESVSKNIISLPSFISIENSVIDYICDELLSLMRK